MDMSKGNPWSGRCAGNSGSQEVILTPAGADEGIQEMEASAHLLEVADFGKRWGVENPTKP